MLEIEDDGVGVVAPSGGDGKGVIRSVDGGGGLGLANVRERLDVLYGSAATLDVTPAPVRGTRARVGLPLELGSGTKEAGALV